jgi:predicted SnoaL-like aldol condensation-catalyzing enzyme
MSIPEENKKAVLRFYDEVWNKGNYKVAEEIFATTPNGRRDHGSVGPNSGVLQARIAERFRELIPDLHLTVEYILAEGDLVAARWRATATHKMSQKRITDYTAVNLWRFLDGRAVEINNNRDDLAVFHQLGLVPSREELFAQVGGDGYRYAPAASTD